MSRSLWTTIQDRLFGWYRTYRAAKTFDEIIGFEVGLYVDRSVWPRPVLAFKWKLKGGTLQAFMYPEDAERLSRVIMETAVLAYKENPAP